MKCHPGLGSSSPACQGAKGRDLLPTTASAPRVVPRAAGREAKGLHWLCHFSSSRAAGRLVPSCVWVSPQAHAATVMVRLNLPDGEQ